MKILNKILLLALLLSTSLFANIATITALKGEATIDRDGASIASTLGAKLQEKDVINTKDKTKLQMIFKDETIVTVGKNTQFSISEYLFDDKDKVVHFGIDHGTMRTITGKIGKIAPERFMVKTKTANIGIRGTSFTVQANLDGSQKVYCTYGAISVAINQATTIVKQGFFVEASSEGQVTLKEFSADDLNDLNQEEFADSGGDSESSESTSTEEVGDEGQLDTTKTELATVTSPKVIEDSKDNLQQRETVEEIQHIIESENKDEPVVEEPISNSGRNNIAVNSTFQEIGNFLSDSEGSVAGNGLLGLEGQVLNGVAEFAHDTQGFGNIGEIDEIGGYQYYYTINEYILNYSSLENFVGDFADVGVYSESDITLPSTYDFENSKFKTALDLDPADSMSWGTWNVSFSFVENGTTFNKIRNGLWQIGTPTDASLISTYTLSSVDYSGIYRAKIEGDINNIATGNAFLNVDFLNSTGSLTMKDVTTSGDIQYDVTIVDNAISSATDFEGSSTSGYFYGTTGNSAGGTFIKDTTAYLAEGVYQVATTENLSVIPTTPGVARDYSFVDGVYIEQGYAPSSYEYGAMALVVHYSSGVLNFGGSSISVVESIGITDFWSIPINTPTNFSSMENFSTNFGLPTYYISPSDGIAQQINTATAITGENFFETVADISSDDSMSWGEWAIEFSYNEAGNPTSEKLEGLWQAGLPTESGVMQSYTLSSVDYSGSYRAIINQNADNIATGTTFFNVNFVNDTGSLTMKDVSTFGDIQYDVNIGNNQIISVKPDSSSSYGHFYGTTGNEAGGSFIHNVNGSEAAKGVYQVQTDTVLH